MNNISLQLNIGFLLINVIILLLNAYIKNKSAKLLEAYKEKLRKRRFSEKYLLKLWNKYRLYYESVSFIEITDDSSAKDKLLYHEKELRRYVENFIPLIPEEIFNAINDILTFDFEKERIEKIRKNHNNIVTLFREPFL